MAVSETRVVKPIVSAYCSRPQYRKDFLLLYVCFVLAAPLTLLNQQSLTARPPSRCIPSIVSGASSSIAFDLVNYAPTPTTFLYHPFSQT